MNRAVFLDRDGVICENRSDYVKSWQEFTFIGSPGQSIHKLNSAGYKVIVVSNQSPIGRGLFSEEILEDINQHMLAALSKEQAGIDGLYHCPHAPWDNCMCRKPKPWMFQQAQAEFQLDLARSFLIGDAVSDYESAIGLNIRFILVLTGFGRETHRKIPQATVAENLENAIQIILQEKEGK